MGERNDRSDDVTDGIRDQERIGSEGQVYIPGTKDGSVRRPGEAPSAGAAEGAGDRQSDAEQGSYTDRSTRKI
jgi:hypothetical protein